MTAEVKTVCYMNEVLATVEETLDAMANFAKEQSLTLPQRNTNDQSLVTYDYARGCLKGFEIALDLVESGRKKLYELGRSELKPSGEL
jgi:hypothetical protein